MAAMQERGRETGVRIKKKRFHDSVIKIDTFNPSLILLWDYLDGGNKNIYPNPNPKASPAHTGKITPGSLARTAASDVTLTLQAI